MLFSVTRLISILACDGPPPPFKAASISDTHSNLTAVLAGFALASFIFLIDQVRRQEQRGDDSDEHGSKAMMLLLVAFVIGSISSFLYSSTVGDPPVRAYFLFVFPSVMFSWLAVILMSGMAMAAHAFDLEHVVTLARRIVFLTALLAVSRIVKDLVVMVDYFDLSSNATVFVYIATYIPLAITTIIIGLSHLGDGWLVRRWIADHTFSAYCYSVLVATAVILFIQQLYSDIDYCTISVPAWLPFLLMFTVAVFSVWPFLLLPKNAPSEN